MKKVCHKGIYVNRSHTLAVSKTVVLQSDTILMDLGASWKDILRNTTVGV
jgi:hypothetical protein